MNFRSKIKAVLLVCLFFYSVVKSQPIELSKHKDVYHSLLQGRLDQAIKIESPTSAYLSVYQKALRSFIYEDIELNSLDDVIESSLVLIEKIEDNSPWKGYYESEILLIAGLVNYKNKKQLEAAWQIRQAYKTAEKNHLKFPDFIPGLKTLGFLQLVLGAVPEKYQWLLSLAGLKGSITAGTSNLKLVNSNNLLLKEEASYLLAIGFSYILGNTEQGVRTIESLKNESALKDLLQMGLWIKNNKSNKALTLFENKSAPIKFPQIYYLAGEAYLQKGQYSKANYCYERYILMAKGTSNFKDVYFKIAMSNKELSNQKDYEKYLSKSLEAEVETAADRNTEKLTKNLDKLNIDLWKMRLAIDGGYFDRAQSISKSVNLINSKDSLEYVYRLARLNHKMDDTIKAVALYQETINQSKKNTWYFAPNAALNIGFIEEAKGNYKKALEYYRLTKSYKRHTYKNSLDSKAEAGINRVKELLNE